MNGKIRRQNRKDSKQYAVRSKQKKQSAYCLLVFMYTFNRERRNINPGEFLTYSVCVFLFITGVLFYIWPYINILNINYKFEKLLKERAKLVQSNKLLKIEMASLKSLDRVENIATTQLGLSFPQDGQIVIIKSE